MQRETKAGMQKVAITHARTLQPKELRRTTAMFQMEEHEF